MGRFQCPGHSHGWLAPARFRGFTTVLFQPPFTFFTAVGRGRTGSGGAHGIVARGRVGRREWRRTRPGRLAAPSRWLGALLQLTSCAPAARAGSRDARVVTLSGARWRAKLEAPRTSLLPRMNLPGGRADSRRPQGPRVGIATRHIAGPTRPRPRPSRPSKRAPSGPEKWASRPARVAQSGQFGAEWGLCWADSAVSERRLGPTQGRLGPTGAYSRGRLGARAGPTRSAEWDPHLWRVALAGSDSPRCHSPHALAPRSAAHTPLGPAPLPCAPPLPVRPLPTTH